MRGPFSRFACVLCQAASICTSETGLCVVRGEQRSARGSSSVENMLKGRPCLRSPSGADWRPRSSQWVVIIARRCGPLKHRARTGIHIPWGSVMSHSVPIPSACQPSHGAPHIFVCCALQVLVCWCSCRPQFISLFTNHPDSVVNCTELHDSSSPLIIAAEHWWMRRRLHLPGSWRRAIPELWCTAPLLMMVMRRYSSGLVSCCWLFSARVYVSCHDQSW